ncbi:MAG: hypothetical protein OXK76_14055 [Gammaproteobacteria bacterium]|nr:hypothetical protein [Gammaproteobacteria bacterium]
MAIPGEDDKGPVGPTGIVKEKKVTIWVNGDSRQVEDGREYTYEQAVKLKFPILKPNFEYTVMVHNAVRRPDGDFVAGDPPVKVQEGTTFDVDETDNT